MAAERNRRSRRLRAALWFGLTAGLFTGAVAMYAEKLLSAGRAIDWGRWLFIGAGCGLAVGILVFLVALALSSFIPPGK